MSILKHSRRASSRLEKRYQVDREEFQFLCTSLKCLIIIFPFYATISVCSENESLSSNRGQIKKIQLDNKITSSIKIVTKQKKNKNLRFGFFRFEIGHFRVQSVSSVSNRSFPCTFVYFRDPSIASMSLRSFSCITMKMFCIFQSNTKYSL